MKRFKASSNQKLIALIGVDQKPDNKGNNVDFLGRATEISPISVQMAYRFNLPIIVAKSLIVDEGTQIEFRKIDSIPRVEISQEEWIQATLQNVMDEISSDIMKHPHQWAMWAHNFWKKKVSRKPTERERYSEETANELSPVNAT